MNKLLASLVGFIFALTFGGSAVYLLRYPPVDSRMADSPAIFLIASIGCLWVTLYNLMKEEK